MAAEEGSVGEVVVEGLDTGDFLSGGVGDDGREDGRGEALLARGVEAVEVDELEEEDEVGLDLSLVMKRISICAPNRTRQDKPCPQRRQPRSRGRDASRREP